MTSRNPRTVGVIVAVATLALFAPTTAAVAAPTSDPVEAAAGYLARQLTDDPAVPGDFGPSAGQTIDAVLGFDAAGQAADVSADATAWLEGQAGSYASFEGTWYSGPLGKLLLLASTRTEVDPADVGGVDTIAELAAIECTPDLDHCEDWETGSYKDAGENAYQSTTYQAYAVLGQGAVGESPSADAVGYLVDQACEGGGFQDPTRAPDGDCTPDVDVTSLAIQALHAVGEAEAATESVDWLTTQQGDDGGFGGSGPTAGANANSTALATQALLAAGEDAAAADAEEFLLSLQAGCDADADLRGAIRYAPEGAEDAGGGPIWATAQALPALAGVTLDEVSGDGASSEVGELDCVTEEPTEDPTDEPTEQPTEEVTGEPTEDGSTDEAVVAEADEDSDELPATGDRTWPLAALAAALLAVGALGLRLTARSRA